MSGPIATIQTAWATIRKHFKTSDPIRSGRFLGCDHKRYPKVIPTGGNPWLDFPQPKDGKVPQGCVRVNVMEYDMEAFLDSCVDKYCELANVKRSTLAYVDTPFINEHEAIKQEREALHKAEELEAELAKQLKTPTYWTGGNPQAQSDDDDCWDAAPAPYYDAAPAPSNGSAKPWECKPTQQATKPKEQTKSKTKLSSEPGGNSSNGTTPESLRLKLQGRLKAIASKVLMKVLYSARLARYDLLRAIGFLATQITTWTVWSDQRLHRIICYINSTLSMRMMSWVAEGTTPRDMLFEVYADSDFAGADLSKRSNGGLALITGPDTFANLSPVSKKQTAVSHSTPEAEIVAADHTMRTEGLPLLDILDVLFGEYRGATLVKAKVVPVFHQDNETALGVIKTGKTHTMKHLGRTHEVDIAWLNDAYISVDSLSPADACPKTCGLISSPRHSTRSLNGKEHASSSATGFLAAMARRPSIRLPMPQLRLQRNRRPRDNPTEKKTMRTRRARSSSFAAAKTPK